MTRPVTIVATGASLPGDALDNHDLEQLVGPLPDDVLEGIQVQRRHWLVDPHTGEHGCANSDMATEAGLQALARAGLDPQDVDLLVVSTASPDFHLPPTATLVQDRLGLRRCTSIDIRSGCAGAVEALDLARLRLETGASETALVIGSEAISPLLVPVFRGQDPERIRMRDRICVYAFGDGAGAVVMRPADPAVTSGVLGSAAACVGGGRRPGMQIIGAGTHAPIHRQLESRRLVELRVDVVETARFAPAVIVEALSDLFGSSGIAPSEVQACILPEGNAGYLAEELAAAGAGEWAEIAGRVEENLALVGATGSAAVPLALDHAWRNGRLRVGGLVVLLAVEASKWKYAGMVLPWTVPAPLARPSGSRSCAATRAA
jgi:3-oxoacyl-[acyl-carrier-protein] synthase III